MRGRAESAENEARGGWNRAEKQGEDADLLQTDAEARDVDEVEEGVGQWGRRDAALEEMHETAEKKGGAGGRG